MKKTIPKLLTLVCLLVAVMGLSIVTAHAVTVTGHRQQRQRVPLSRGQNAGAPVGPYTSNKLSICPERYRGDRPCLLSREPEGALTPAVICSIPPRHGAT